MCVCTAASLQIGRHFLQAEVLVHTHVQTFSGIKFLELLYHLVLPFFIYGFWCYVPLQHTHTIVVGMVPVMSSVQTH